MFGNRYIGHSEVDKWITHTSTKHATNIGLPMCYSMSGSSLCLKNPKINFNF